MKIVMITRQFTDISFGGVENHIFFLSEELVRAGHDVLVIRLGKGLVSREFLFNFKVIDIGRRQAQVFGQSGRRNMAQELFFRLLGNSFSRKQFSNLYSILIDSDIVHFHDFLSIVRLAKKVQRKGKRVVWTNHLGEFLKIQKLPFGYLISRFLSSGFDIAIAPSLELSNNRAIKSSVNYIPNAVDVQLFSPVSVVQRANLKLRYGIAQNRVVYLVPRRWAPTKGVLDLVRELATEHNEDCLFLFVGSGSSAYEEYRAAVTTELSSWKIEYKVIESASIFEMSDYYKISEFTFIPSREEATSLAALEAMACGSIVLANPVGGLVQLITNGDNGLLADPNQSKSLLGLFHASINLNNSAREKIVSNALEMVKEKYSWSKVGSNTLNVYAEILHPES
jgi:glycosyltransferase involved in cell wall biosynthesis